MSSVLLHKVPRIFQPPFPDELVAAPCLDGVPHAFETTGVRQETKFHTHAKQAIQL